MQDMRIDSNSVVAHRDPKLSARIFDFYFDSVRTCVYKCIHQYLAANAVDFVTDHWPQRTRNTVGNQAEVGFTVEEKFLPQSREGRLEALVIHFRCAQPAECISAFFSDRTHQLKNSFQERLGGRIRGELVFCDVKLESGAQNTLQQGVMEFLRNPRTLGEPLLETNTQSVRQLMNSQPVNGQDRQATPCKTSHSKPPRLPKCWFDDERDRRLWAVPKTETVGGNNVKTICARVQVFIDHLPRRNCVAPALIGTIELIAKADAFWRGQVRAPIIQGDALNSRRNRDGILRIHLAFADGDRFDSHRHWNRILGGDDGIGQGQT